MKGNRAKKHSQASHFLPQPIESKLDNERLIPDKGWNQFYLIFGMFETQTLSKSETTGFLENLTGNIHSEIRILYG